MFSVVITEPRGIQHLNLFQHLVQKSRECRDASDLLFESPEIGITMRMENAKFLADDRLLGLKVASQRASQGLPP